LNLEFDAHHSSAEDGSDSPWGSNNVLGTAGFFRGTTTVDFTHDLPVLNVALPSGMTQIDPAGMLVTGSSFRNAFMRDVIDQVQLHGDFTFANASRLDFGVASTDVKNRSAFSNVQLDTWGGATSAADYPDSVWHYNQMGQYFDQFDGSHNANLTDSFFTWNFGQVRQLASDAWVRAGHNASDYMASPIFTTDRRVTEKSKSAYAQWSDTWDWHVPVHFRAGIRYEDTDVTSKALVPIATAIQWQSANELNIVQGSPGFTMLSGDYKYWLPSADISFDVTDDVILRASYGRTIGRPGWGDIQGGQTLDQLVRVDGGTGAQGNPALKPLVSNNYDVSAEWYYDHSSYVSLGAFRKNIDNYIGVTQLVQTPFDLHTPVGGAFWNEALSAGGCLQSDVVCIRDYIFLHHDGTAGVTKTGVDSTGHQTGTIVGQPGDPIAKFRITAPANQRSASLDGLELAWQHVFGETGFGVAANYTYVHSGLTYNNYVIGEQFALEGLSNSANFVPFYEKGPWAIRLAYNWRGQFLSARFDGTGPNPVYVEPYGQVDLSVTYQFNKHFSAQIEAINLTNETMRSHGRTKNELEFATQTGTRYLLGLRYKF
jgi:TonB-dependent receptor